MDIQKDEGNLPMNTAITSIFPNFFIIGAPQCGTTALYDTLTQHPEIYMSPVKEPHYFTFDGDPPTYHGLNGDYFKRVAVSRPRDYLMLFKDVTSEHAIGEASTSYLRSEFAAERISEIMPHAKIIAILRQPAERAYSHYQYLRCHATEPATCFRDALEQESKRKASGWSDIYFYYKVGLYYPDLCRYYKIFPREQVKVYLYEDWNRTPEFILRDLYQFLGVDDKFVHKPIRSNVTRIPKSKYIHRMITRSNWSKFFASPFVSETVRHNVELKARKLNDKFNLCLPPVIDENIRFSLTQNYREDIFKLQDLICRDLSHWL